MAFGNTIPASVQDPSCGSGAFLVAALDELVDRGVSPDDALRRVSGIEIDSDTADEARAVIRRWARSHQTHVEPQVTVGDGLDCAEHFDVIVGNPPFGGQLRGVAVRDGHTPSPAAYTDTAVLFLADAVRRAKRVLLIQPQPMLGSRDAQPVRGDIGNRLEGLWWSDDFYFDASVRVCAPLIGEAGRPCVQRWFGSDVTALEPSDRCNSAWARLLADVPAMDLEVAGALSDIAKPTADFRDAFYEVAQVVTDDERGLGAPVVTCGLIDLARCRWGQRTARIAKRDWRYPRADPDRLGRWATARLVPKVLVATQTKAIECVADPKGELLPITPVVSVATGGSHVWEVAAVLSSPVATALVVQDAAGTGLGRGVLRINARQLGALPLPAGRDSWEQAAASVEEAHLADDPTDDLLAAARSMNEAYGLDCDHPVLAWWAGKALDPNMAGSTECP